MIKRVCGSTLRSARVTLTLGLALGLLTACATQTPASDDDNTSDETAEETTQTQAAPKEKTEPEVTRDDVKSDHPVRYTVRRGDTLWDIASRFLRDPWLWPEIWSVNPQIDNPHLIYPGDVITLTFVDGKPRLVVQRPGQESAPAGTQYKKLEPKVRERPLSEAIQAIPSDAIRQFLNRPRIVSKDQLEDAPYIVGNYEGRLLSAEGRDVFARGFDDAPAKRYNVYRPGEPLHDPDSGELLGYDTTYVGKSRLQQTSQPPKFRLTESVREINKGDRMMTAQKQFDRGRYIPQTPAQPVDAEIIKLFDAISQAGKHQVVALNYGERDGARISDVLGIMQSGGQVKDPHSDSALDDQVQLPPQRVGSMMVFRVFDKVSYALILEAKRPVETHDSVTNP